MNYKHYEFSIKVRTNHDPRDAIFDIVQRLKDVIPVLSIDYHLVEERPTSDEHHGGITDDSDS